MGRDMDRDGVLEGGRDRWGDRFARPGVNVGPQLPACQMLDNVRAGLCQHLDRRRVAILIDPQPFLKLFL